MFSCFKAEPYQKKGDLTVCEKTHTSHFLSTSLHFHRPIYFLYANFLLLFQAQYFMILRILGILLYINQDCKIFPSAHKLPKLVRSRISSFLPFLIAAIGKNVEVAFFFSEALQTGKSCLSISLMTGMGLEPTTTQFVNEHSIIQLTTGQFG